MAEEVFNEVIETVDTINHHRMELNQLMEALKEAQSQVTESADKARSQLQKDFGWLRSSIIAKIDSRLESLLKEVDQIESDAVKPLAECEEMIQTGMNQASNIMETGKEFLKGEIEPTKDNLSGFKDRANSATMSSLPEVPSLAEVACITVELPRASWSEMVGSLDTQGKVIGRGPVQITEFQERPGGVLVRWADIEDESSEDVSEYQLQYCYGSVRSLDHNENTVFTDIYQGPNTSHLARDLRTKASYTFRVRGKNELGEWSPWSFYQVSSTSLPHHEWQDGVEGYSNSNENKTAARSPAGEGSLLYSSSASYKCGHSLSFRVHSDGTADGESGIGLAASYENSPTLLREGGIFVSAQGAVYIDGQEMTTRLPKLACNSVLVFETEVLQNGKVRVTIETGDKNVTFDWNVKIPQNDSTSQMGMFGMMAMAQEQKNIDLYFAMKFANQNWKISVE